MEIDDRERAIKRAIHYLVATRRMQPSTARDVAIMVIDAATWNVTELWKREFHLREATNE